MSCHLSSHQHRTVMLSEVRLPIATTILAVKWRCVQPKDLQFGSSLRSFHTRPPRFAAPLSQPSNKGLQSSLSAVQRNQSGYRKIPKGPVPGKI